MTEDEREHAFLTELTLEDRNTYRTQCPLHWPQEARHLFLRILVNERLSFSGSSRLRVQLNETMDLHLLARLAADPPLRDTTGLYGHALRTVPTEHWPLPLHNGEFPPHPGHANVPDLALFLAKLLRGFPALQERLRGSAATERAMVRKDMSGSSLRPHLIKCMEHLVQEAPERILPFLAAMDTELRRLDIVRALSDRKKKSSSPIKRAVYRGSDGKRCVLHLAELDSGDLGLLFKPKSRYVWTEGAHDDVLATIPDRWFAEAAQQITATPPKEQTP